MIKHLYAVVSKGSYYNTGRRQLSSIKEYENVRSQPPGTSGTKDHLEQRTVKLVCIY